MHPASTRQDVDGCPLRARVAVLRGVRPASPPRPAGAPGSRELDEKRAGPGPGRAARGRQFHRAEGGNSAMVELRKGCVGLPPRWEPVRASRTLSRCRPSSSRQPCARSALCPDRPGRSRRVPRWSGGAPRGISETRWKEPDGFARPVRQSRFDDEGDTSRQVGDGHGRRRTSASAGTGERLPMGRKGAGEPKPAGQWVVWEETPQWHAHAHRHRSPSVMEFPNSVRPTIDGGRHQASRAKSPCSSRAAAT